MPLPGNPDAIEAASQQLATAARSVLAVGQSVTAHGTTTTANWTGLAAPLALARTQQDAAAVQRMGEAATGVVAPLATYAEELRAAQRDFARGEEMVAQGHTTTAHAPGGQHRRRTRVALLAERSAQSGSTDSGSSPS
ncbi:hypothetical protein LQ327_31425 [Actinomycetospora endophytica]|uniref:Excreted virulence factor EspC (Type VII ESX diderm) n=1 Tax=Actinomycetospora endophytica TaxID=2291215 RepID=A0ABS8PI09_9PSEU|nr:hypothetical protein [Actinomycetospora endophytica]MCD2197890.1 hypothetical protein [Actinomycetospora endophytica]